MKRTEKTEFPIRPQEDSECKELSQYGNGQDIMWGLSHASSAITPFQ